MKKIFTSTIVCLMAFFYSNAQTEEYLDGEEKFIVPNHTVKEHIWPLDIEVLTRGRFGLAGFEAPVFQLSGNFIVPVRLDKGPKRPLFINTRFGYHKPYSLVTGFGGCIGKPTLWVTPQAVVVLGNQNGIGLGLVAQAKSELLLLHYETNYVVDYWKANDSWFSVIELTLAPRIRGERPLQLGIEIENRMTMIREDELIYSEMENELTTSFIVHYFPHENWGLNFNFNVQPFEVRERFLTSSAICFGLIYRFEKHTE